MGSNGDHIKGIGCWCGPSSHVVVDGLVVDLTTLAFGNSAAAVCWICLQGAVRGEARVHTAPGEERLTSNTGN